MQLDKKQKILVTLIIIVLGVLAWQLYGMLADHHSEPAKSSMPAMNMPAGNPPASMMRKGYATQVAAPVSASGPVSAPAISDEDKLRLRSVSESQAEYLKLLNEYQLLQVQRRIAEDTRAIAVAKLETAKALVESSKITGNNNLDAGLKMPSGNMSNDYKLVFTGQESGQWTATLKVNDQLMDVVTGTTLPDGFKVMAVDGDTVTLQKDNKQKIISFLGTHESTVNTVSSDDKHENAAALLQIVAPEKLKKKPADITPEKTANAVAKTESASIKAIALPAPIASKLATNLPVVATDKKVAQPVADKQSPAKVDIKTEEKKAVHDKADLTAAFLGKEPGHTAMVEKPKADVKPEAKKQQSPAPAESANAIKQESKIIPEAIKAEAKNPVLEASKESGPKLAQAAPVKPTVKTVEPKPVKPIIKEQPKAESIKSVVTPIKPVNAIAPKPVVSNQAVTATPTTNNYTLQLMSDRDEASVKAFINKHNLGDKANYFPSQVKGKTWYVLVYGQYASFKEARNALAKLPKAVRDWDPFVRKLNNLPKASVSKSAHVETVITQNKHKQQHTAAMPVQPEAKMQTTEIVY